MIPLSIFTVSDLNTHVAHPGQPYFWIAEIVWLLHFPYWFSCFQHLMLQTMSVCRNSATSSSIFLSAPLCVHYIQNQEVHHNMSTSLPQLSNETLQFSFHIFFRCFEQLLHKAIIINWKGQLLNCLHRYVQDVLTVPYHFSGKVGSCTHEENSSSLCTSASKTICSKNSFTTIYRVIK